MIELGKDPLTLEKIKKIIFDNEQIIINKKILSELINSYELAQKLNNSSTPIYGLNTGFGALAEFKINLQQQEKLQKNIILSHAVGVSDPLNFHVAKTILLLRLNTLVMGYSIASPKLVESLAKLVNSNCAPIIPKKGSVGASGDLAPLAHLGLLLLGKNKALIDGKIVSAKKALAHAKITDFSLGLRDGLALLNGTQAMSGVGIHCMLQSQKLCNLADLTSAITLEALGGHSAPFDERIHKLKPFAGQITSAQTITNLIKNSKRAEVIKNKLTQDPYSLRCIPQVHGATREITQRNLEVVEKEINSATDNPLFFRNGTNFDILSGGNFHGQMIALTLDFQAMAISELANISERRIELLINPRHSNGLPAFLVKQGGINSGFMMLHVTSSALVNENKILTHPASTDSIPTSAGREDHVSMGMTAANKLAIVIENTQKVLEIELLSALQALDLREKKYFSPKIKQFYLAARKICKFSKNDCLFINQLEKLSSWISSRETTKLINELIQY